ncbi:lipid asymmetry maintenance protein MlaB [Pseudomonas sp. MAG002Y]|jgi:anti-sigma B factor antagonist|uniref:STAS domain-containing protein n=1 Tax=Pseudomonas sp. MAG002Y TaxID=2678690 RepID=UPI001C60DAAA|nr:STAS domain-containing protein [Pseudomonas sp. MAG002Y]MBW5415813.1 STAS domain-containing protein [Pseudomonas sp. MAG002Y]
MTEAFSERQSPVIFEGPLTIYTAAESKAKVLEPLKANAHVEFDLAAVDEFDSAGLQLLILAKHEAARINCTLSLCNHSPAVIELLELSGLVSFFGDPLLIQPQMA